MVTPALTQSSEPEKAPHAGLAPAWPEPGRWRLIIADDDPAVRSFLSMSLREGFDVLGVAGDAEEAIELARGARPDVALIDVQMPGGGGLHAVRSLLEVSPDTAVVMLSVDESDATVRQLLAAGAITYCRKGTSTTVLAQSLLESIKARERERRAPEGTDGSAA
jgi:DNA-binding NarL/FixJ family response regulator